MLSTMFVIQAPIRVKEVILPTMFVILAPIRVKVSDTTNYVCDTSTNTCEGR